MFVMKHKDKEENIGMLGEDVVCRFLERRGFSVLERNYRKFIGEIDIIARKGKETHFVEVKTVSRENVRNVNHETSDYRPEENVHPMKLKRIFRTIQIYLSEKSMGEDSEWVFDVAAVYFDEKNREARVSFMENVVI